MDAIWGETIRFPRFATLKQDISADVLVIGGGLAGLLCAYRLTQAGADCVLIEANTLCSGVTSRTTAKITAQHGLIYQKLMRESGVDAARLYWQANQEAVAQYRTLADTIDCDFQNQSSYVYARKNRAAIDREAAALAQIGVESRFTTELPLPFPVAGALEMPRQAQFHPLKFLAAIAKGLRIYEHTKALELSPQEIVTSRGRIFPKDVVIATHFPLLNKHGGYFLKLYQQRSYVLALESVPSLEGMYWGTEKDGISLRHWDNWLLLGGGGHRTGKKGGGWPFLEDFARRYYPGARITCRWATQDCMTLDGVPYAGRYGKNTPHLFVTGGFNKWGFTSAMAAAGILVDLLQGRENPYAPLFNPARTILRPQLAANILESTVNLLTPTVPRCPHMGCALKYNPQEHSWDCPCHGSRFSEDGELLDNPATDGLPKSPPRRTI